MKMRPSDTLPEAMAQCCRCRNRTSSTGNRCRSSYPVGSGERPTCSEQLHGIRCRPAISAQLSPALLPTLSHACVAGFHMHTSLVAGPLTLSHAPAAPQCRRPCHYLPPSFMQHTSHCFRIPHGAHCWCHPPWPKSLMTWPPSRRPTCTSHCTLVLNGRG